MRKRNFKGRCEKRQIAKCAEVCRTYDDIQRVYAERLSEREGITEISCHVMDATVTVSKKQAHPRRYNYRLGCAFMDK